MSKNLRDYGLGNYTEFVIGRPHDHAGLVNKDCPNCHLDHVHRIQVVLEGMPQFTSRLALGTYLGCPACPYASPCVIEPINEIPAWWRAI